MGYESRIYIAHKNYHDYPDGTRLCFVLACINASKCDRLYDVFSDSNCWIYADDGNTEVRKDRYGDCLKEAKIQDVVDFIRKKEEELQSLGYKLYQFYPGLHILYHTLIGFTQKNTWKNLVCLHYGY